MNWVDFSIIAIVTLSASVGLARGIVRELLSLGVWIAALLVAWLLHREVADLLVAQIAQPSVRIAVAFIALVLVTLLLGAILGAVLTAFVDKAGLTGADRVLGFAFGAGRGAVIVAMAVFLAALTPLPSDPGWQDSRLIVHFQGLADWIFGMVPDDIQALMKQL
ncbi:CvpA family protein [uncultured Thiocystis sp.]|jgi:membrane protein required for colicin V production|uniref:CvpA family protein n=1 Tax=uncultured Thiocystis sp. TaxID=1202134 RepID=UPI0025DFA132|nr:CvpA family protein [uncultured Thiocystis sp.]